MKTSAMIIVNKPSRPAIIFKPNSKEDDCDQMRVAAARKEAFKRMEGYGARIDQQIKESRELIKSWEK